MRGYALTRFPILPTVLVGSAPRRPTVAQPSPQAGLVLRRDPLLASVAGSSRMCPASLLATGRGIASAVIARAQPPTALLSVRLALSFPITSRRSASAGWSLGKVFATRLPTAALWPVGWGSPSWVAGPRSGWSIYFMGRYLLLVNRCSRCARHRRPF